MAGGRGALERSSTGGSQPDMQLDNELCQAQHKTNQINQQMITQVSAVYSCVFEQDALMPYVKQ